jgi:hypothetical protein
MNVIVASTPEGAQVLSLFEAEMREIHRLCDAAGVEQLVDGERASASQRVTMLLQMADSISTLLEGYIDAYGRLDNDYPELPGRSVCH